MTEVDDNRLVIRDESGHVWAVESDGGEQPESKGIHCLLCGGHPVDYSTGVPGDYRPCPQAK